MPEVIVPEEREAMPDASATSASERLLTAVECARRTGVTVRALRVYERNGPIRPRRTEKGWRLTVLRRWNGSAPSRR